MVNRRHRNTPPQSATHRPKPPRAKHCRVNVTQLKVTWCVAYSCQLRHGHVPSPSARAPAPAIAPSHTPWQSPFPAPQLVHGPLPPAGGGTASIHPGCSGGCTGCSGYNCSNFSRSRTPPDASQVDKPLRGLTHYSSFA